MKDHYENELRQLHEHALEFARNYPEQAGMLDLHELSDKDPYIERLLEGVAYLTAGIRRQLEQDYQEISEVFLRQFWSHMLCAYPSSVILQFGHERNQMSSAQVVAAQSGARTETIGNDNIECRFTTDRELVIRPLFIRNCQCRTQKRGNSIIHLEIGMDQPLPGEALKLDEVEFYLQGDAVFVAELLHALQVHVKAVEINGQNVQLPTNEPAFRAVLPCMQRPYARSEHEYFLLQDYFCYREKFNFVSTSLLSALAYAESLDSIRLDIELDKYMEEKLFTNSTFNLNCVPASNIYVAHTEPVYITGKRHDYRLVPDVNHRESVFIHKIKEITVKDGQSGRTEVCEPFVHMHHDRKNIYFEQLRNVNGRNVDHFVSLADHSQIESGQLSCEAWMNNGDYPRRYLHIGSISRLDQSLPKYLTVRNLHRPSRYYPTPDSGDYQWLVIANLSFNLDTLGDIDRFRALLTHHDRTASIQNRRRIEAIQEISLAPDYVLRQGAYFRGTHVHMILDESGFLCMEDMYQFGSVLHHYLQKYAGINAYIRTTVECYPSQREFTWVPELGMNQAG